jgi:hypothetical protein
LESLMSPPSPSRIGLDPNMAEIRSPQIVEKYEQCRWREGNTVGKTMPEPYS